MKRRRNLLNWTGFAVVLVAIVSYVPFFALFPATRDIPWVNYVLFLAGGVLLAAGIRRAFCDPGRYYGKISGPVLAAISALLFGFFVFSVTYFSRQLPSPLNALHVGQNAPPFTLADTEGRPVSSAGLLKDRRGLLLIFYRGYW